MNGTRRGITKRALATLAMLILGLGTALIGLAGTAGSANAAPTRQGRGLSIRRHTGRRASSTDRAMNPIEVSGNSLEDWDGTALARGPHFARRTARTRWQSASSVASPSDLSCLRRARPGAGPCPRATDFEGEPYPVPRVTATSCDESDEEP